MSNFPYKKLLGDDRFAYVVQLTFGRGRINISSDFSPMSVDDAF